MATIWKNVNDVKPGEVLADDVFDGVSFTLILRKGEALTEDTINLLRRRNVKRVPIYVEGPEEEAMISREKIMVKEEDLTLPSIAPTVSEKTYNESIEAVNEVVNKILETDTLDKDKIRTTANKIVAEVFSKQRNVLNLIRKHARGFLHKHLVNTGVIAGMIAVEMGMPIYEATRIAEAGMLHDLGLAFINVRFESDIEKLDDEIANHPAIGAKYLREAEMPSEIIDAVLFHHERWDGKGFPMGLEGKRIPTISRIIAVADAYDTLTSEDLDNHMPPYYAMRWIVSNSKRYFDPDIVSTFVKMVGIYPTGTKVQLSDGRTGVVVGRSENLLKPFIDINGEVIDLSEEENVWILKVL
ncbi:MAG: HD domain-containing protein [Thermotogaceae bacterium]|nr:HD domain-containing protein [Thermotogaceae bacterium]